MAILVKYDFKLKLISFYEYLKFIQILYVHQNYEIVQICLINEIIPKNSMCSIYRNFHFIYIYVCVCVCVFVNFNFLKQIWVALM